MESKALALDIRLNYIAGIQNFSFVGVQSFSFGRVMESKALALDMS
jgi:hypothetical protein